MSNKQDLEWGTEDWKRKLKLQAEDSREYRYKLYEKVELKNKKNVLDVGCGTGAITLDLAELTNGTVTGIDSDPEKLKHAEELLKDFSNVKLIEGNAEEMPFEDETFDLVVFNVVLIHIKDQQKAVSEMARVTEKDGIVLATLEPDYEHFIEYPETPLAEMWKDSVKELGADLSTGRKLKYLFTTAGLKTTIGIDGETEFLMINDDKTFLDKYEKNFWVNEKIMKKNGWTEDQIKSFKEEHVEKIKKGLFFSFPVCFYAIGNKP